MQIYISLEEYGAQRWSFGMVLETAEEMVEPRILSLN